MGFRTDRQRFAGLPLGLSGRTFGGTAVNPRSRQAAWLRRWHGRVPLSPRHFPDHGTAGTDSGRACPRCSSTGAGSGPGRSAGKRHCPGTATTATICLRTREGRERALLPEAPRREPHAVRSTHREPHPCTEGRARREALWLSPSLGHASDAPRRSRRRGVLAPRQSLGEPNRS